MCQYLAAAILTLAALALLFAPAARCQALAPAAACGVHSAGTAGLRLHQPPTLLQ